MTAKEILERDGDFRNVYLRPLPPVQIDEEACAKALESACEAARILRSEFGATKVILFGSLASKTYFESHSDIDRAVYGIGAERFFRAYAMADDVDEKHETNIVDGDDLRPGMREDVEREGIVL